MRLTIKDSCYIICSSFNCITMVCAIKEWVNFVAGSSWIREWLVWSTGCVEGWPEAERLLTSYLKGRVLDCIDEKEMETMNQLEFIQLTDWPLLLAAGCLQSAFTVVSGIGMRQPSVAGCSSHTACKLGLDKGAHVHSSCIQCMHTGATLLTCMYIFQYMSCIYTQM